MATLTEVLDQLDLSESPDAPHADAWRGQVESLRIDGLRWASAYHIAAYRLAATNRGVAADFILQAGPAAERRFKAKSFRPGNSAEDWLTGRDVWAQIEAVAKAIYDRGAVSDAQIRKIARQAESDVRQAESGG